MNMENASTSKDEKKKVVYLRSKELLQNIYKKCKEESVSGLQIPLEQYEDRVLNYTGAPRYVLDVVSEQTDVGKNFDLFEKAIICDTILNNYKAQKPFSFKNIHDEVQVKVKMPDLSKFTRDLRASGFMPLNTLNYGSIVLEDPKITFERFEYLNKITKFRAIKKYIYYLDERIVDLSRSFKKPWLTNMDTSKIDGYIFFHITSKHGFEKGLFCNQANEQDLRKWVSDIVLPSLNPSSVIVMDKSPLHGKTVNEPLTRLHSKSEMVKWLQNNNIPCTASMRKAQLFNLIARCPVKESQYSLDLIFRSHGHEVVRLPENFHDLSVTELMWEHVGTRLTGDKDADNLSNLRSKILNILKYVISNATWEQFDSTIEATEGKFFDIDEAIENALIPYEIDINNVLFE